MIVKIINIGLKTKYIYLQCYQGATMDVDEEDLVPEITKKHFEESMKFARR